MTSPKQESDDIRFMGRAIALARAPPGLACHSRSCRAQMASSSFWSMRRLATVCAAVPDIGPEWHAAA